MVGQYGQSRRGGGSPGEDVKLGVRREQEEKG
jgi:hypothetical protein